jgi:2'-5' RNA ligase
MPEWLPGRELWAFYLTFADDAGLHARIGRDQAALAGVQGLEPIPTERLHLSVQGIAFRDLVHDAEIDRLAAAVGALVAERHLPQLQAGPAMNDYDAVGLPVHPAEEIVAVRDLIRLTAAELIGSERIYQLPESESGFVPHISIGYSDREISGDDLAAGLEMTEQAMTPLDVQHLSLVALRRANKAWSWEHEVRLPFAQNQHAQNQHAEPSRA